jgi:hypothetical protein
MVRVLAILLAAGLATPRIVAATAYVPMDDATLTAASAAIVTGTVTASAARKIGTRFVTETTVAVDQVFKGAIEGMSVTVTTPGGRVGDEGVVVFGAPSFAEGEAVLLFLQPTPRGEVRTTALALGAWELTTAADGSRVASRTVPTPEARALDDLAATATAQALTDPGGTVAGATAGTGTPVTANFTFLGSPPGRWFQADSGTTVRLSVANADAKLGTAASNGVVDDALAAWTDVASASIVLARGSGGTTGPSIAGGTCDGRSTIQFNDPESEIPALTSCTGVLAIGGFCVKGATGVVNGTQFARISEGDLTINDGVGTCFTRTEIDEVATHEVGHAIGMGHSSENPNEPNPTLRDATMYFLAHFDGRGASLRSDDIAGVSAIYPNGVAPTDPDDGDGDGVPNASDACPSTPAGFGVDANGCGCGEAGHVVCDDGLRCTDDQCNAATSACASTPVDCTGGDPCLTGACNEQAGCATAPVVGNAAVLCVYARPYPPAACAGERVPKSVQRHLHRAARLTQRGLDGKSRLLTTASRELARARRVIERAAARKRKAQGPVCASALMTLVDDARSRLPL